MVIKSPAALPDKSQITLKENTSKNSVIVSGSSLSPKRWWGVSQDFCKRTEFWPHPSTEQTLMISTGHGLGSHRPLRRGWSRSGSGQQDFKQWLNPAGVPLSCSCSGDPRDIQRYPGPSGIKEISLHTAFNQKISAIVSSIRMDPPCIPVPSNERTISLRQNVWG